MSSNQDQKLFLETKRPEPYPLDMDSDDTDGFYWQSSIQGDYFRSNGCPVEDRHNQLPVDVFVLLTGKHDEDTINPGNVKHGNRWYQTAEEAMADLAAAIQKTTVA